MRPDDEAAAFHFEPLTQADAEAVADWRYPEPYSFYDWTADPDDLRELLEPARRGEAYWSVRDDADELVGYFDFKPKEEGTLEIGLGLRPDLTGRGMGASFLAAGLSSRGRGSLPSGSRSPWRRSTSAQSRSTSGRALRADASTCTGRTAPSGSLSR